MKNKGSQFLEITNTIRTCKRDDRDEDGVGEVVTELWIYYGNSNGLPKGDLKMERRVINPTLEIISNTWADKHTKKMEEEVIKT